MKEELQYGTVQVFEASWLPTRQTYNTQQWRPDEKKALRERGRQYESSRLVRSFGKRLGEAVVGRSAWECYPEMYE